MVYMSLIKDFTNWFHLEFPEYNLYLDFDELIKNPIFKNKLDNLKQYINDNNLIDQLSDDAIDELKHYNGADYIIEDSNPDIDPITDEELKDLGLNRDYLNWTFNQYLKYFDYIIDAGAGLEELIGELENKDELYIALYLSKKSPIKRFLYKSFKDQLLSNEEE